TYSSALSSDALAERVQAFTDIGTRAATEFVQQLHDNDVDIGPLPGLPESKAIALDIEQKLCTMRELRDAKGRKRTVCSDDPKPNANAVAQYGRLYAKAVTAWITRLQHEAAFSDVVVVLYTTPSVYGDYFAEHSDPDDNLLLSTLPLWIARTTPDGG